jgi:hypothetical protein
MRTSAATWKTAAARAAVDEGSSHSYREIRVAGGSRVSAAEVGTKTAGGSVPEILDSEEAKGLLESAQARGRLRPEEVAHALDQLDLDADEIDDFYSALAELEIAAANSQAEPFSGRRGVPMGEASPRRYENEPRRG